MAKKTSVPEDKLRLYQHLLEAAEGPQEKTNFGSAYTAVNGNMYSMISKYGVVGIRLPAADKEAFMKKFHTDMFRGDPAWPPSKELIAEPDDLLQNTAALKPYMELSYQYARSLKPKLPKQKPET